MVIGIFPLLLWRPPISVHAADLWEDLPPLPTPRQEVGVAALGSQVYVLGGITADRNASNVVERYDAASRRWGRLADLPRSLHHLGAAGLAGKVYSIGGLDQSFRGVDSCYAYDPISNRWTQVTALPRARGGMGIAVLDGRIYAAGGQSGSTSFSDLSRFTPSESGGAWEVLPAMRVPRNHLAAAAAAGGFFAVSGRSSSLRPEVERYDPLLRTWADAAPIPTPRGGIAAAVIGQGIYVFGGEGSQLPNGIFPQTERLDLASGTWSRRADMSVPRHGIGAAAIGERIYIPGGAEVEGFNVTDASTAYLPGSEDRPRFVRGDANGDGGIDIADVLAQLFYLFVAAAGIESECLDAFDVDDDGSVALDDVLDLLGHLFLEVDPAAPLAGELQPDLTPDHLGCEGR